MSNENGVDERTSLLGVEKSDKLALQKLCTLSWPVLLSFLLQYIVSLVALGFVGHLGKEELAAAGLATMFANVMGFSVGIGFAAAMDTLCSQLYGAGHLLMLGVVAQRAALIMGVLSLPLSAIWWFADALLVLLGQDEVISAMAARYLRIQIICLWPSFIYTVMTKYLQNQGLTHPPMHVSGITAALSPMVFWLFTDLLGLGFDGNAFALAIVKISQPLLLLYLIVRGNLHHSTWPGFSRKAFQQWRPFLALGLPACIMICAEWWAAECLALMAGWLGTMELAAQSILGNVTGLLFMFPLSVSIAASILVGHMLGEGNGPAARHMASVSIGVTAILSLVLGGLLYFSRHLWLACFTADSDVTATILYIVPILVPYAVLDGIQITAAGALRGCGRQIIGAYCNLFSFYALGIPTSLVAAFLLHYGFLGIWIGNSVACVSQAVLMIVAMVRLDWSDEVDRAKDHARSHSEGAFLNVMEERPSASVSSSWVSVHENAATSPFIDREKRSSFDASL